MAQARIGFVQHKGVAIYLQDFSGVTDMNVSMALIAEARAFVDRLPKDSLYIVTDVTGSNFNMPVLDGMRDLASHHKPFVRAAAIAGLTPLMRIVYTTVTKLTGRDIRAFATREGAMDWLAERATGKSPSP